MADAVKLDFSDVLMVPRSTSVESRSQVNLVTTITGKHGASITGVPIIAANMVGVGTFDMNLSLSQYKMFTAIQKHIPPLGWVGYYKVYAKCREFDPLFFPLDYAFITVGMGDREIQKIREIRDANIMSQLKINIDVANGYMKKFPLFVRQVRDLCPDAFIIAGTVCTPEACDELVAAGADLARVGIGTGAVCTTRLVAGVGYPQFSAVQECATDTTHKNIKLQDIVCDGGCYHPGDFAKAFGAGATMVMAGSVFAGHDEGGIEQNNGKIRFHGNAAIPEPAPDGNNYRSSEGRIVEIPYKGSVTRTVEHILGGLRSACAYSDTFHLDELYKKAEFIQVNNQINRVIEHYTV
jgi:GMP reductase